MDHCQLTDPPLKFIQHNLENLSFIFIALYHRTLKPIRCLMCWSEVGSTGVNSIIYISFFVEVAVWLPTMCYNDHIRPNSFFNYCNQCLCTAMRNLHDETFISLPINAIQNPLLYQKYFSIILYKGFWAIPHQINTGYKPCLLYTSRCV